MQNQPVKSEEGEKNATRNSWGWLMDLNQDSVCEDMCSIAKRTEAATTIQAAHRGRQVRMNLKPEVKTLGEARASQDAENRSKIDMSDAATKVQDAYRDQQARVRAEEATRASTGRSFASTTTQHGYHGQQVRTDAPTWNSTYPNDSAEPVNGKRLSDADPATDPTKDGCLPQGPRAFRSLAHGIRGIARAQAIADEGVPIGVDVTGLVQRIAVTLSSQETFQKGTASIFKKFRVAHSSAHGNEARLAEPMLPMKRLPDIFEHYTIPQHHIPIFWAMLRKQPAFWDSGVMPEYISYDDFHAVIPKVLRRVRDRYCGADLWQGHGHPVAKDRLVVQNARKLEQDYIIDENCGRGTFGECFFVTHRQSKAKRVAKKMIKQNSSVPTEEMQGELNTLKMLDHPNILRIFEWFESEDAFVLVVEAAFGGDVRSLLVQAKNEGAKGLPELLVQNITAQALTALAYIHSMRVIHRDVKPANLLLTTSAPANRQRLVLADFGVADLFDKEGANSPRMETGFSSPRLLKGTLAYMAPEVFTQEISPRTDVWALGIIVYELLCGERPFTANNPMAMYKHVKTASLELDVVIAVASEAAAAFCSRSLSKSIVDRPSAAEAMMDPWVIDQNTDSAKPAGRKARKIKRGLSNYMQMSYFSQTAMNCVAAQLDTKKLESLVDIYRSLDTDHDGRLTLPEFAVGLAELGVDPESIDQLVDAIDINHDGFVEFTEFVASLLQTQGKLVEEVICHAFRIFDTNDDHKISLEELHSMLSGDGPLVPVLPDGKTVEQVLSELDTSKDGAVSFHEFRAYLAGVTQGQEPSRAASQQQHVCTNSILLPNIRTNGSLNFSGQNVASLPRIDLDTDNLDEEPLGVVLVRLAPMMGRSENELLAQARRLEYEHWMSTIGDLRNLADSDWPRLGLPLKLERALRTLVFGMHDDKPKNQ